MDDYKKQQEEEAKKAIRRVASIKTKPYLDEQAAKLQKKAGLELSDLGVDEDYLKYVAGLAKAADSLNKQEIEGSIPLNDDLTLEGKLSPKEKAIKLLYNKGF